MKDVMPAGEPDLTADHFGDPLFIHMAALAALRGQPTAADHELLALTLGHERSYWRKLLKSAGMAEKMLGNIEQTVALLTLTGGVSSAQEAKALVARTPRLRDTSPPIRTEVFDLLRRLYPLGGGLSGLNPNLLGETLVSEALAADDEILDAVLGEQSTGSRQVRHALTVLTRLAGRVPSEGRWLRIALDRHLLRLCEDALYVGMETGSPMPEILGQAIRAADLQGRRKTVDKLRIRLPAETHNLTSLSVDLNREHVELLEGKKVGKGDKRDLRLSDAFLALAAALRAKGLMMEAARAALEAERHAAKVFQSNTSDDLKRLGRVLGNAGAYLREVCRYGEALERGQQAEQIWRRLSEKQPDAFTANWAMSLGNLANRLGEVGRHGEALEKAQQSKQVWRDLAQKQPDAFMENWAISLANLAEAQLRSNEVTESLESIRKAKQLLTPLVDRDPAAKEHWMAFVERVEAEALLSLKCCDEAAAASESSVSMWSRVGAARQGYHSVQVAKAFRVLMRCQIALQKNEMAIATLGRAFELLRKPLSDNPRPLRPLMSELLDLAVAVDGDSVNRVVPSELLAIIRASE